MFCEGKGLHGTLIDDIEGAGGYLIWILYSYLEDLDLAKTAKIAKQYGPVITQSSQAIIDEERAAQCMTKICDELDDLSPIGFYFGFPPGGSTDSLGWYSEIAV